MDKASFDFLYEFNLQDYLFEDEEGRQVDVVPEPSDQEDLMLGWCRHVASSDGFTTRKTIHDACFAADRNADLGGIFNTYSGQHLADVDRSRGGDLSLEALFQYAARHGVVSKADYDKLPSKFVYNISDVAKDQPESFDCKHVQRCPRLFIEDIDYFSSSQLAFQANDIYIENVQDGSPSMLPNYLCSDGPAVGVIWIYRDIDKITEEVLYIPDAPLKIPPTTHAMLITGYGLAKRIPDGLIIPYYCCQNTWGEDCQTTCRMPASSFLYALAPRLPRSRVARRFPKVVDANGVFSFVKKDQGEFSDMEF